MRNFGAPQRAYGQVGGDVQTYLALVAVVGLGIRLFFKVDDRRMAAKGIY